MKQEQRKGFRGRHPDAWARAKIVGHVALALWFAYWAWTTVEGIFWNWPAHLDIVGVNGRLYYRAAATFVAGGDPWTATTAQTFENTWPPSGAFIPSNFAGPPPTVLAFVPFVWIPEWIFVPAWLGLTVTAAVYTIRRLRLPIYWLLFPPLVSGISVGNPHIVCLALLLCSSNWLRALAVPMKVYAAIPMVVERQWRALVTVAVAGVVSVVAFWPLWHSYIVDYGAVQDWMVGATDGGFSAARDPRLFAVTAVAIGVLALVDRRAAGWLAVPALWPVSQYFYATFILPLRSPWLAAVIAVGGDRADARIPWAIVAYAGGRVGMEGLRWLRRHYPPRERVVVIDDPHGAVRPQRDSDPAGAGASPRGSS